MFAVVPTATLPWSSLQVNTQRAAMCDAATILLRLNDLAATSRASAAGRTAQLLAVERAQELSWLLCDALGTAQALMERHGTFAHTCLSMLRTQLELLAPLRAQAGAAVAAPDGEATDGAPDAEELHAVLTAGLQHCLHWLFGLELPELENKDIDEWGGGFQVGSVAACLRRRAHWLPLPARSCVALCLHSIATLTPCVAAAAPCRPSPAVRRRPGS